MQEYIEAKKELDEVYRKGKEELAHKIRPVFHQKFKDFFEKYPEVQSVSWSNRNDIYNDEEHYDGIESINFIFHDEYMTDEAKESWDKWSSGEDKYYDLKCNDWLVDTGMDERLGGRDRCTDLSTALREMYQFISRTDIEFLQTVFDVYCDVTVTKEGFTVE